MCAILDRVVYKGFNNLNSTSTVPQPSELLHPLCANHAPQIMGILNVTPDSFSDGAKYQQTAIALRHAEQMVADGANIIDIGGESTRPGASAVSVEEELRRVIPLIKAVKSMGVAVSVDTSKPEVMLAAAEAGADMLNDVRALGLPGALQAAAKTGLAVCLMHMQGQPNNMQSAPQYANVLQQVSDFLQHKIELCVAAGIERHKLCVDPGFGFGKTLEHNLQLLNGLHQLKSLGLPLLVGLSRKSMLGQMTGREVGERMPGSIALALIALQQGADIIRVHDVKPTQDIKQIFLALKKR